MMSPTKSLKELLESLALRPFDFNGDGVKLLLQKLQDFIDEKRAELQSEDPDLKQEALDAVRKMRLFVSAKMEQVCLKRGLSITEIRNRARAYALRKALTSGKRTSKKRKKQRLAPKWLVG
jgi:aryl carrier-like protein